MLELPDATYLVRFFTKKATPNFFDSMADHTPLQSTDCYEMAFLDHKKPAKAGFVLQAASTTPLPPAREIVPLR
jgi:hypothetical protein